MGERSAHPSSRFGFAGAVFSRFRRVLPDSAADLRRAGGPDGGRCAVLAGTAFAVYATAVLLLPLFSVWGIVLALPVFLLILRWTSLLFVRLAERGTPPRESSDLAPPPLLVAVLVFVIYLALLLEFGVIRSPDTQDQWEQIATGQFDDWHPVMHTLSIYLFALVWRSEAFVLGCFIGIFALLCGWLASTLRRCGYRAWVVWTLLLLVTLSRNSQFALRVLWKDSEFALALLYLGTAMIHLWHTNGKWLFKLRHALPTAAVLVYAAFVRHNGIFFVVPFLMFLPLLPRSRAEKLKLARFSVAVALLLGVYIAGRAVLTRRGMLDGRCGFVEQKRAKQSFGEAVGMPMTMMGEAFTRHPEKVPPEAAAFLAGIAPHEKWRQLFHGEFNEVKFSSLPRASTIFNEITPGKFCRMFLATLAACPLDCLRAFVRLSALAWDPCLRMPCGFGGGDDSVNRLIFNLTGDRLWAATGLYLLALFFAGAFAFIRRRAAVFFMTVPFFAYSFGTALLLAGNDHRFFWGIIIAAPLAVAALLRAPAEKRSAAGKTSVSA